MHDVTPGTAAAIEESEEQSSWGQLARRALSGDGQAGVDELLTDVHRCAFRYARARLGPYSHAAHAADDVAQEVCIAVLTSLPRYIERGVPFEAFVYTICARKVADVQRATYRLPVPTDAMPETVDLTAGPEESVMRRDEADHAWALLEQLPDQQREILTLRVAVGLSADETARSLSMSPGAVRVAQHRALNRLRRLLEKQGVPQ